MYTYICMYLFKHTFEDTVITEYHCTICPIVGGIL